MPITLQSNGWSPSTLPWAHFNPRHGPLADETAMSYEGGNQVTMPILIYPQDLYQWISELLGKNIYQTNGDTRAITAVPVNPGLGYAVNDVLTLVGGSSPFPGSGRSAMLTVNNVNASDGSISIVGISDWGSYQNVPPNPVSVIGGSGTGALFNINWTTGGLNRTPPMAHPIFEWLYCTRITSIKGYVPTSKAVFPHAISNVVTTVPQFYILNLLFQQPKYRMLSDDDLNRLFGNTTQNEWQRFVEGWPHPRTENIGLESGVLGWAETGIGLGSDGVTGQIGPKLNDPLTSQVSQPLKGQDITLTWKRVPMAGLFSAQGIQQGKWRAVNLENALQTVNASVIFGYPIGTLKFVGYKLRPIESALPPETQTGTTELVGAPNLLFDVDLSWTFSDPPYDLSANGGFPTRGHNLSPWRGKINSGSSDGTGNILWYKFAANTKPPSSKGSVMFPFWEHSSIFAMVG